MSTEQTNLLQKKWERLLASNLGNYNAKEERILTVSQPTNTGIEVHCTIKFTDNNNELIRDEYVIEENGVYATLIIRIALMHFTPPLSIQNLQLPLTYY